MILQMVLTPLGLKGGGEYQENDHVSFVNQNHSTSELGDLLFDAGHTIEDIDDIITSKLKFNETVSEKLIEQAAVSG